MVIVVISPVCRYIIRFLTRKTENGKNRKIEKADRLEMY